MKLPSDSRPIVDRKKVIQEISESLNIPYEEVKIAVKSQTLLIERGMGTKSEEWHEIYHPIRLQYIGVFKPTKRRALYVEKRMLHIIGEEIEARLNAQKELDEFLKRHQNSL